MAQTVADLVWKLGVDTTNLAQSTRAIDMVAEKTLRAAQAQDAYARESKELMQAMVLRGQLDRKAIEQLQQQIQVHTKAVGAVRRFENSLGGSTKAVNTFVANAKKIKQVGDEMEELGVDSKELTDRLNKQNQEQLKVTSALKGSTTATTQARAAWDAHRQTLGEAERIQVRHEQSLRRIRAALAGNIITRKQAADSIRNQRRETAAANARLREMNAVTIKAGSSTHSLRASFTELSKAVQIALGPLSGVAARVTAFSSLTSSIKLGAAGITTAFIGLSAGAIKAAKDAANLETAMIGVAKTADIQGSQLVQLTEDMVKLSTKMGVTTMVLGQVAQAAGQMGIKGTANILAFTEAVAKLTVTTNLGGEEAATQLARLINITGGAVKDIGGLADVLVKLGNNFAATEKEILHMAGEIARGSTHFKVSAKESLALAAALRSMGARAEQTGTAVSKVFGAILEAATGAGDAVVTMSNLMGRSTEQLKKDIQENATETLLDFLEALRDTRDIEVQTAALKQMGLRAEESLKVLRPFIANIHLARKAFADSAKAAGANTEEFKRVKDTLTETIKSIGVAVQNLSASLGTEGLPALKQFAGSLRDFVSDADKVTAAIKVLAYSLGGAFLLRSVTALTLGIKSLGVAFLTTRNAMLGMAGASTVAATGMGGLAAAGKFLMGKGPWLTALGLTLGAMVALGDRTSETAEKFKDLEEQIKATVATDKAAAIAKIQGALIDLENQLEQAEKRGTEKRQRDAAALFGGGMFMNMFISGGKDVKEIAGLKDIIAKLKSQLIEITEVDAFGHMRAKTESVKDSVKQLSFDFKGLLNNVTLMKTEANLAANNLKALKDALNTGDFTLIELPQNLLKASREATKLHDQIKVIKGKDGALAAASAWIEVADAVNRSVETVKTKKGLTEAILAILTRSAKATKEQGLQIAIRKTQLQLDINKALHKSQGKVTDEVIAAREAMELFVLAQQFGVKTADELIAKLAKLRAESKSFANQNKSNQQAKSNREQLEALNRQIANQKKFNIELEKVPVGYNAALIAARNAATAHEAGTNAANNGWKKFANLLRASKLELLELEQSGERIKALGAIQKQVDDTNAATAATNRYNTILKDSAKAAKKFLDEWKADQAGLDLIKQLGPAAEEMAKKLVKALKDSAEAKRNTGKVADDKAFERQVETLKRQLEFQLKINDAIRNGNVGLLETQNQLAGLNAAQTYHNKEMADAAEIIKNLTVERLKAQQAATNEKTLLSMRRTNEELKMEAKFMFASERIRKERIANMQLERMIRDQKMSDAQAAEARNLLKEQQLAERQMELAETFRGILQNTTDTVVDEMTRYVMGLDSNFSSFSDFLRAIEQQIISAIFKDTLTKGIDTLLTGKNQFTNNPFAGLMGGGDKGLDEAATALKGSADSLHVSALEGLTSAITGQTSGATLTTAAAALTSSAAALHSAAAALSMSGGGGGTGGGGLFGAIGEAMGGGSTGTVGMFNGAGGLMNGGSGPVIMGGGTGPFNEGGAFTVGGAGGQDSTFVPLMLTPGELVQITPANAGAHERGGGGVTIQQNFNISTPDANSFRRSQAQILADSTAAATAVSMRMQ